LAMVAAPGNGVWAQNDIQPPAPRRLDRQVNTARHAVGSRENHRSDGITGAPSANIFNKLVQASCTACDSGDCDGGCASSADGGCGDFGYGGGCDDFGCGGGCGDCACMNGAGTGLARMMSLFQGGMCNNACGGSCGGLDSNWYASSRPPKRMGGGPFRKYGPCWYTAPTEWTLFGVFPLATQPTCLSHPGGDCGTDCGCAVYVGNRGIGSPQISRQADVRPSDELRQVNSLHGDELVKRMKKANLVSVISEPAKETSATATEVRSPQPLKKPVSFRQGNVTRAAYSDAERRTDADFEEPARLPSNEPQPIVKTEALQPVPPRQFVPQHLTESTPHLNRSSFGKASLKMVK